MEKFHILRFDSTANTFTLSDAGISYSFSLELSNEEIETLQENDYIFGYRDYPANMICCLFTVLGVSANTLRVVKKIEVSDGIKDNQLPDDIKSKLTDTQRRLFEISSEDALKLKAALFLNTDYSIAPDFPDKTHVNTPIDEPFQLICFGAPGTGKSNELKKRADSYKELHKERVTFYPTYTYQQFVGAYKPYMTEKKSSEGKVIVDDKGKPEREISYKYVPGPFLRLLTNALLAPTEKFLLIIEELNRANAASVFGDVFQLLDRNEGKSEYSISISEDMKNYFIDVDKDEVISKATTGYTRLYLPCNFYIWATMNSADQGVFPIDTAFKRRWRFEYLGINTNDGDIKGRKFKFKDGEYEWNAIRIAINDKLLDSGINEDKMLGPFFIKPEELEDPKTFMETFKSKVLMYLFEDVVRHRPNLIFKGERKELAYSKLCSKLDDKGLKEILDIEVKPTDASENQNEQEPKP